MASTVEIPTSIGRTSAS